MYLSLSLCARCPRVQLFVRAFAKDGSSKSILVDEKMTVGEVCSMLADKHHRRLTHAMAVVEHMPELFMGEQGAVVHSLSMFLTFRSLL